jgi:hypothetical protein
MTCSLAWCGGVCRIVIVLLFIGHAALFHDNSITCDCWGLNVFLVYAWLVCNLSTVGVQAELAGTLHVLLMVV